MGRAWTLSQRAECLGDRELALEGLRERGVNAPSGSALRRETVGDALHLGRIPRGLESGGATFPPLGPPFGVVLRGEGAAVPLSQVAVTFPSFQGVPLPVGEPAARLVTRTQEFFFHASETPRVKSRVPGSRCVLCRKAFPSDKVAFPSPAEENWLRPGAVSGPLCWVGRELPRFAWEVLAVAFS
jgi:hypothetical protein